VLEYQEVDQGKPRGFRFTQPQTKKPGSNQGPIPVATSLLGFQRRAVSAVKFLQVTSNCHSVTAEVASSSLVVPAILSKARRRISLKPLGARKRRVSRPFCALFRRSRASYPATRVAPSSSEEKTSDITAACAACFAGVTACVKFRASPRPTTFYAVPRKRSTISGSIGSTASV
jgi:hypothetical protein